MLGLERTFATPLVEVTVNGKDLRSARTLCAKVLSRPPIVAPVGPAR